MNAAQAVFVVELIKFQFIIMLIMNISKSSKISINTVFQSIQDELDKCSGEVDHSSFFKEGINSKGIRLSSLRRIARRVYAVIKCSGKENIFSLCERLFETKILEDHLLAGILSYHAKDLFKPEDFHIFEHWLGNYVSNWAECDQLCNHAVGDFIMMYPQYAVKLKDWAHSDSRWMKRGAAVSFIIPVKKGMFLDEILAVSDILLQDEDDLVRKGTGWM